MHRARGAARVRLSRTAATRFSDRSTHHATSPSSCLINLTRQNGREFVGKIVQRTLSGSIGLAVQKRIIGQHCRNRRQKTQRRRQQSLGDTRSNNGQIGILLRRDGFETECLMPQTVPNSPTNGEPPTRPTPERRRPAVHQPRLSRAMVTFIARSTRCRVPGITGLRAAKDRRHSVMPATNTRSTGAPVLAFDTRSNSSSSDLTGPEVFLEPGPSARAQTPEGNEPFLDDDRPGPERRQHQQDHHDLELSIVARRNIAITEKSISEAAPVSPMPQLPPVARRPGRPLRRSR